MHSFIALLAILLYASGAQPATEPVTFTHQIRQFIMTGDDTTKVDLALTLDDQSLRLLPENKRHAASAIPYATITHMVYDRRSRVRKMASNWGKAEDHFLTIHFTREGQAGDFVELELGKNTAPRVLATLEARSGKKIERSSGS